MKFRIGERLGEGMCIVVFRIDLANRNDRLCLVFSNKMVDNALAFLFKLLPGLVAFNLALARYDHPKVAVGGLIRRSCHYCFGKNISACSKRSSEAVSGERFDRISVTPIEELHANDD
jgi:uncharacterized protein YfaA (DUF2138 family)